ncbi:hypothetical protein ACROYT_G037792 [Oculina patagonica]
MSSSTLIEVFGQIVFRFTRGVTEHYNPEEPEFTAESFGYDPVQSTGREWNYLPVDEFIYQEYSDREATSLSHLASIHLNVRVTDACSLEENEETHGDQQVEDRAMAWKRLRPSALRTVCKSMYIGALISLLTATIIGSVYMLISYLCLETVASCEFYPKKSIPIQVQWMRSISDVIRAAFLNLHFFICVLFIFRPHQLMGVKRKLILVYCFEYCFQALFLMTLQALGISHSKPSTLQKIPIHFSSVLSACWQVYLLTNHFRMRRTRRQIAKADTKRQYNATQQIPQHSTRHATPRHDKAEDGQVFCTSVSQVNRKEFDESVVPKEREVERIKVLKSGDVQKTLKSNSSSPSTVDQDLEEDAKKDVFDAIRAHLGN